MLTSLLATGERKVFLKDFLKKKKSHLRQIIHVPIIVGTVIVANFLKDTTRMVGCVTQIFKIRGILSVVKNESGETIRLKRKSIKRLLNFIDKI